jgi:hypothetical protein
MVDGKIHANGVNGMTGEYLLPPLDLDRVADVAKGTPRDDRQEDLYTAVVHQKQKSFGLPFNVKAEDPGSVGWGIVFEADGSNAVQDALKPLIEHRRAQFGDARVKVLDHKAGEAWDDWLGRHEVGPGTIVPDKVPYYLLLVGAPALMSFEMQYLLDVEYAVGRIDFDDIDAYARYAAGVVEYETNGKPRANSAAFFATQHQFDDATQLSATSLVGPLAASFAAGGAYAASFPGLAVETSIGKPSTKAALGELFGGNGPMGRPSIVFSATHGMGGWKPGHKDQASKHGALLCQDWPGLGSISPDHYFAAADLPSDADVHGLISFFFACYSAGTPQTDPFDSVPGQPATLIAPEAFVAALPKALLSHENGPALAAIGHIERAWGFSIESPQGAQLLMPFVNAIGHLLMGQPIGFAMRDFSERYALLSADLATDLEKVKFQIDVPAAKLADNWLQRNDAQNYIVIGDPAVRLKVA